ncbi:MAG: (Na+)-NQR maturation NqrM [Gammaproteobacteria bacterium]|jgi:hypothetical protein
METIIVAFFVMLALTAAMAVGVIFGRQPIAGSCGGMKALGMEMECEVCGGDPQNCEKSPFAPDGRRAFSGSAQGPSDQGPGANELSRRVGQ